MWYHSPGNPGSLFFMFQSGILKNSLGKQIFSLTVVTFTAVLSNCQSLSAAPDVNEFPPDKIRICQNDAGECKGNEKDLNNEEIKNWFSMYDGIRRKAQMSPKEKSKADRYLHRGFAILIPGFGRIRAHKLLKTLINRYEKASSDLERLPEIPETKELKKAYVDFFKQSHSVFKDCNKLLVNPFAYNKKDGFLKKSIKERHKKLKSMESDAKTLDQKLRDKHNIEPYK